LRCGLVGGSDCPRAYFAGELTLDEALAGLQARLGGAGRVIFWTANAAWLPQFG